MPNLKLISFIFIYILINSTDSLQNNETNSVKQSPKIVSPNQTNNSSSNSIINNAESINFKNSTQTKTHDPSETKMVFQTHPNEGDVPESIKMGFYIFIGLSITGILFILLKMNRMRLSRAERKYGVHGDRTTQELTPLPMAIEDDSENEDHTVFDINRQIRVS